MQDVYGDDCPSKPAIYKWLYRFKVGRESFEDASRSVQPKVESGKENVERVKEAIEGESRLTVADLEETLGISHSTIHRILVQTLGLSTLVAKCVPKLLTAEQKKTRKDVCKDLH
ncbi:MAG: helix-turn-helix domain-containing protein [Gammaproteobacteria bacterium]|nr:helix-turn-helix domain-containing protein [Gammaproteobacteria bacterium]